MPVVLRVFKNNPKYRFRGPMHEQIIFSIEEECGKNKIQPTNVKIVHYGYDQIYVIWKKSKKEI